MARAKHKRRAAGVLAAFIHVDAAVDAIVTGFGRP